MKYIENVVIGRSLCSVQELFSFNDADWQKNEMSKTWHTNERFLPKILVELEIYPSVSQIRKNRPDLMIELNKVDFISKLKVSKKRYLWICVGSKEDKE